MRLVALVAIALVAVPAAAQRRHRHRTHRAPAAAELAPELVALDREAPPPMDIGDADVQARIAAERQQMLDPELFGDESAAPATREALRYSPLDVRTTLRVFERTLSYLGYERGPVSDYALPFGLGVGFGADYFPGAHATNDWLAHLGVSFDLAHSLFVQSSGPGGVAYPTTAYSWILGVRARFPLDARGASEIALEAGGGETGFRVERGSLMQPAPQGVPATDYDVLRVAADARIAIGEGALLLRAGYLPALSTGRIAGQEYFPGASAHGVEAAIGFRYAIAYGFEVHAEAELRLFVLSFGNPEAAAIRASGAIDQSVALTGGVAWRMPPL